MARPQKWGLDYFPFDVDFFEDAKLSIIRNEFGSVRYTTKVTTWSGTSRHVSSSTHQ